MAQIIAFQKAVDKKNHQEALAKTLSGKKVRLVDYFCEEFIEKINLLPVNEACVYEKHLVELCNTLQQSKPEEKVQALAETLLLIDLDKVDFHTFVEKIAADDLIFGCIVSEISQFSQLDKLFLLNVLCGKFPEAKTVFNTLKLIVFANHEMLEAGLLSQEA